MRYRLAPAFIEIRIGDGESDGGLLAETFRAQVDKTRSKQITFMRLNNHKYRFHGKMA